MAELSAKIHMDSSEVDAAIAKITALDAQVVAVRAKLGSLNNDLAFAMNRVDRLKADVTEVVIQVAQTPLAATVPPDSLGADCPQCTRRIGFTVAALTQRLLVYCPVCDAYYRVGLRLEKPSATNA